MKRNAFQAACFGAFALVLLNLSTVMFAYNMDACAYVDSCCALALLIASLLVGFGLINDHD